MACVSDIRGNHGWRKLELNEYPGVVVFVGIHIVMYGMWEPHATLNRDMQTERHALLAAEGATTI